MDLIKSILDWVISFFNPGPVFFELMKDSSNILFGSGSSFTTIIDSITPIGIGLAMVYISKEFLEKTSLSNIDLEQIIKMFMKLVVVVALVNNVSSLFVGMNSFSNAIYDDFSRLIKVTSESVQETGSGFADDIFADGGSVNDKFSNIMDPGSADDKNTEGVSFDVIGGLVAILGGFISSILYIVIITWVSCTRSVKLGYKAVFAPVMMANITGYSTRSAAIQYCKEVLAIFMQLPIAYIGLCFAIKLVTGAGLGGFENIVIYIIGGIWVSSSARISTEIFA